MQFLLQVVSIARLEDLHAQLVQQLHRYVLDLHIARKRAQSWSGLIFEAS